MRVLLDDIAGRLGPVADEAALAELYDTGAPWWRANLVTTVDGALTGIDGTSDSVTTPADQGVYALLRALADAVVVGAGTVEAEGFGPVEPPEGALAAVRQERRGTREPAVLVVVSAKASVPGTLRGADPGRVLLATVPTAPSASLREARELLGEEHVLVLGEPDAEFVAVDDLRAALGGRGLERVLVEGGPSLLEDCVLAEALDELCLTTAPMLYGGPGHRLMWHTPWAADLAPTMILEEAGTLMTRWAVRPGVWMDDPEGRGPRRLWLGPGQEAEDPHDDPTRTMGEALPAPRPD